MHENRHATRPPVLILCTVTESSTSGRRGGAMSAMGSFRPMGQHIAFMKHPKGEMGIPPNIRAGAGFGVDPPTVLG